MKTDNLQQAIDLLYESIETEGLIPVLYTVFGQPIHIKIPLNLTTCEADIEALFLSVRAYNGLRRAGIFNIRELTRAVNDGVLTRTRNLGKKSCSEIETKLLAYCYAAAPTIWRREFIGDLLKDNQR